jgi:hypothetical protein
VGLSRGFGIDGRRGGGRQAGVAWLPDLDRAVVDELGRDHGGGGGDDGQADRSLRGKHRAGSGRRSPRPGRAAQQAPFDQ